MVYQHSKRFRNVAFIVVPESTTNTQTEMSSKIIVGIDTPDEKSKGAFPVQHHQHSFLLQIARCAKWNQMMCQNNLVELMVFYQVSTV